MANDVSLFKAVPFGRRMRDTHFLISSTYTPLNHGSFGTYPKAVRERLHEVQTMAELRPDHFMRYQAPKMLDISRAAIAAYVNAPVDEIVLVPNASTATNVVLRSLKFEPGDTLLYLSTAYGAVQKTVKYLEETTPVEGTMLTISHPLADDEVVAMFKHAIKNTKADGKNVRAALFDTVSSLPGVRTPWERLVQLCREEKVLSVVDGAHSVGQIPTDLDKVQPDFFTSNLHK